MKLPIPLFLDKKPKTDYFMALLLHDEKINAVIMEELEGKIKVIGSSEEEFKTNLEGTNIDELLEVLDRTISKAEETLPLNIETQKTVFGVKESWVEEKKIKKEYLAKLKRLCEELDLSPIGFMVVSEAISNLIHEEEGAPLSAILAEVGKKSLTLSLFRGGKLVETKTGPIEENVPSSVDKLLKTLSAEILPSRIIIFNGAENEELTQSFIAHAWSKSLPFLHVPQISVLPSGFDARAVVFGAANQLGFEVFGPLELKQVKIKTYKKEGSDLFETGKTEKEKNEKTVEETIKKPSLESELVSAESLGFNTHEEKTTENLDTSGPEYELPVRNSSPQKDHKNYLTLITSMLPKNFNFANFRLSMPQLKNPLGGLPLFKGSKFSVYIAIIILLILGFVTWYFLSFKAIITLSINPKVVEQKKNIQFTVNGSNDFNNDTISAKTVSSTVDGSVSGSATGKKDIGNKAQGSVTLYNATSSPVTLTQSTTVASSNGLVFTLDSSVTIASSSGSFLSPGTASVNVTANILGTEYNLPSATTFTVAGYDNNSLVAKNNSAFSGGTKQTVTVISQTDLDKLVSNLTDQLSGQLKDKLEKQETDQSVLTTGKVTVVKKSFDKKIGDQASSATITGTLEIDEIVYNNQDVKNYVLNTLKNNNKDLSLSENNVSFNTEDVAQKDDNTVTATLSMKGSLTPGLDLGQLKSQISGKSTNYAKTRLLKLAQVGDANIRYSPNIFFLPKFIPFIRGNIQIQINTNGQ